MCRDGELGSVQATSAVENRGSGRVAAQQPLEALNAGGEPAAVRAWDMKHAHEGERLQCGKAGLTIMQAASKKAIGTGLGSKQRTSRPHPAAA